MDVISYYFIRKEKTSLSKKKVIINATYVIILGAWAWFCAVKVPQYQEAQRSKVHQQEQQVLREMHPENYYITEIYSNDAQVIIENIQQAEEEEKKEKEQEFTAHVTGITEPLDSPEYTEADLNLLAQLIEAEGGIESYQCKLYIGSVVLNRMTSDRHPDSLREVIFEDDPCVQFSVTIKNTKGNRPIDCEPSEDSINAAAELLTNGTQLPENVLVFYSTSCKGNWVNSRKTYVQIDHTIFAYDYSN